MSNPLTTRNSDIKSIKETFLDLIASGYTETLALSKSNITRGQFLRYCDEDPEFIKQIEESRRSRAEVWVSKIAENIDIIHDKEDVPGHKLRLEKLVFLAKADNPDRYGTGKTKVDISLDLKNFKLLSPEDSIKALSNDPFAIEAEYTEINDEELL